MLRNDLMYSIHRTPCRGRMLRGLGRAGGPVSHDPARSAQLRAPGFRVSKAHAVQTSRIFGATVVVVAVALKRTTAAAAASS